MYLVDDVAKYVLNRTEANNDVISNLKLQKVLYFIQAEFLIVKGKPCFNEKIEAWDFGPVVPTIYIKYKIFGCCSIFCFNEIFFDFSEEDKELMNGIIDRLKDYSATDLTQITINQKPWTDAYSPYKHNTITNKSLFDFFKN